MAVSENVVRTDQRLERAQSGAAEALAEHRWHWTMDETNGKRVSFTEYAKAIGRNRRTVTAQAQGFASWQRAADGASLNEHIERARMSSEKAAVTQAVAKARGVEFKTARQKRGTEIQRTRAIAQDRAEKRGTSVEEEAEKVATMAAKLDRVSQQRVERKRGQHSLRFLSAENELAAVVRRLGKVLSDTEGVEFSADERELLAEALGKIKAVLGLIDLRLTGDVSDVDWDGELEKLAD